MRHVGRLGGADQPFAVRAQADALRLECGQTEGRVCADSYRLRVDVDPSRLTVDLDYRYAYLPHLLGRRLTVMTLDGEQGPELVDIEREFFREDGLFDSGLGGGFEVVKRACDVASDNAPLVKPPSAAERLLNPSFSFSVFVS